MEAIHEVTRTNTKQDIYRAYYLRGQSHRREANSGGEAEDVANVGLLEHSWIQECLS